MKYLIKNKDQMGCIIPPQINSLSTGINLLTKDNSVTVDFKDFFSTRKPSSSVIKTSFPNSCSLINQKGLELFSDISSIEEKHPTKSLSLQLFDVIKPEATKPIDIIKITQNDLESKQGKLQKINTHFSFGSSPLVDYNIPDDPHIAPNQFDISYDESIMKFYINDAKESTGVFKKINQSCLIENGFVFNYGNNNCMKFRIDNAKQNQIIIHFLEGEFKEQIISFDASHYHKIRLGRAKTNEIIFDSNTISRVQWTIVYKDSSWIIYDGSYEEEEHHPSTNGLWRLITEKTEIADDSLWKTGGKMFKAKINH